MRSSETTADARRPGLAWAIGVLDAAGRFGVTTRRRGLVQNTPTECAVAVTCTEDVGLTLTQVFGGLWVAARVRGHRGIWRLRESEIADVLYAVIPLMRNGAAVRSAQAVLAVRMTKVKPGGRISEAVRRVRLEAVG